MKIPNPKNISGTKVVNQWGSDPQTSMIKPTQYTRDQKISKPNYSPEGSTVNLNDLGRNSGRVNQNNYKTTNNRQHPSAGQHTGTYEAPKVNTAFSMTNGNKVNRGSNKVDPVANLFKR